MRARPAPQPDVPRSYTIAEAVTEHPDLLLYGVSEKSLRKAVQRGRIGYFRLTQADPADGEADRAPVRLTDADIRTWVASLRHEPTGELT